MKLSICIFLIFFEYRMANLIRQLMYRPIFVARSIKITLNEHEFQHSLCCSETKILLFPLNPSKLKGVIKIVTMIFFLRNDNYCANIGVYALYPRSSARFTCLHVGWFKLSFIHSEQCICSPSETWKEFMSSSILKWNSRESRLSAPRTY